MARWRSAPLGRSESGKKTHHHNYLAIYAIFAELGTALAEAAADECLKLGRLP
jgi:hypothetical protein